MPRVEPRVHRGRLRQVNVDTGLPAVNSRTGTAIDGLKKGWRNTPKNRKKAARQAEHVNEAFLRKRGRI